MEEYMQLMETFVTFPQEEPIDEVIELVASSKRARQKGKACDLLRCDLSNNKKTSINIAKI
jgi:hypothetical protein